MKIPPEIMSKCVKFFKSNGVISSAHVQMKAKVSFDVAAEICKQIEKRFPNLWREGKEKFIKQYIGHR